MVRAVDAAVEVPEILHELENLDTVLDEDGNPLVIPTSPADTRDSHRQQEISNKGTHRR